MDMKGRREGGVGREEGDAVFIRTVCSRKRMTMERTLDVDMGVELLLSIN